MSRTRPTLTRLERTDLPTALRQDAPTRRAQPQFIEDVQPVLITGLRIPFFNLVWHLIKLALAAIPALIVLALAAWGLYWLYQAGAPEISKLIEQWLGTQGHAP